VFANILSYYKQDIGRQKALEKAYRTQVLLTSDKLNSEIICKLFINLAPINSFKASVVLINGYVSLNLINHIFTVNKQLFSLADKRVKAIKSN
jgi:hypothetical protein